MECAVCGVRSAVGYCVECQKMLCEECGTVCEMCNKTVCPEHVKETRSGRRLCVSCYEARKERRRQHKEGGDRKAEDAALAEGMLDEELEEEELLTASAQRGLEPWQWSLIVAAAGLAIIFLLLIVPSLRRIPLGGSAYIPTPFVLLLVPAFAGIWAVIGLTNEAFYENRPKCLIGIALALVTVVLAFVAVATDPAKKAELEALQMQEERDSMTQEGLTDWRKNALDRYER
ncbi:MAG: hypothetical protein JXR94_07695 [Candidatus Hydrogenedentes bacterium]|nr:hypothetical protein [Candidatus Hydrogenedentota bacterium]